MKVCTDACLFGAWAAEHINRIAFSPERVLDIGAGTGLLSLMLAQKVPALIDAVEIDGNAASQARENFDASPWHPSLKVHHTALQNFSPKREYDIVISNPPFFGNDLKSIDETKNSAKHDTTLTMNVLLSAISQHLTKKGYAFLLVPFHRTDEIVRLAALAGLFIHEAVSIKQSPAHAYFRTLLMLSKQSAENKAASITIHDEARNYSPEFIKLLTDYYLKL